MRRGRNLMLLPGAHLSEVKQMEQKTLPSRATPSLSAARK